MLTSPLKINFTKIIIAFFALVLIDVPREPDRWVVVMWLLGCSLMVVIACDFLVYLLASILTKVNKIKGVTEEAE